MQKKIIKSIYAIALVVAMMLSLTISILPTPASAATTQAEIDSLKSQRSELKSQQSSIQSTINSLKGQQNAQLELKQALDEKNAITQQQIVNTNEQIELHNKLIEQKTAEVDEAQKDADKQLEKYKVRVRAMEEAGRYNYFEVLFGANSISEFLSLIDDIGDIMQSDKDLENSYRDSVKKLKAAKEEYEKAKAELEENRAELVALEAQQKADMAAADAALTALAQRISANSASLSNLSSEEAALQAQIQQKIKELNAQQQQQQQGGNNGGGNSSSGGGSVIGTGSLVWPSYCTYITSRQGPRTHPVTGEYKNHGGTDIGASYGSAIYAADSGTVVASSDGWNGGWGNYVMIDHGNGMQTLYAHMSSRACSVGQSVSRGQTIGYVGSSGMSTGAHLHFEMYINGSRVDPQTYYPGISFSYSPSA